MDEGLKALKEKSLAENADLAVATEGAFDWFEKLVSNCATDPTNAMTYIRNASFETGDYVAKAIAILNASKDIFEMQQQRKLRKNDFMQNVAPILIMSKLLKQINERTANGNSN